MIVDILLEAANNHMTCSTDADQSDAAGERRRSFHCRGGPVTPLGDGENTSMRTNMWTQIIYMKYIQSLSLWKSIGFL